MKTIIKYKILIAFMTGVFVSCGEYLDTEPTDRVSGSTIFNDAQAAKTAINGSYSMLWRAVYVSGNTAHAYGYQSTLFAQELMGDDVIQKSFNWFGWDYDLSYTTQLVSNTVGTASRSYNVWNMNYTVISNANYIIAEDGKIGGDQVLAKNVLAQAYALRALCYFELIQGYQFTYLGNESKQGVPVYTEPTRAGAEGKPRGTVADVYELINSDLARSIELFTEIGKPVQEHSSFVDYYVAKGFQARVALVQGRWADAYEAAAQARSKRGGVALLKGDEILNGFNNRTMASNLWAMEMLSDQSPIYGSYFCHLDANPQAPTSYGHQHRKCISKWLYDKIANTNFADNRVNWFKNGDQGTAVTGENVNYGQMKLRSRILSNWVGDIILMRAEEMLLIQAEAKSRLGDFETARTLLNELAAVRLTSAVGRESYNAYITNLANANTMPTLTNTDPTNILEEVILQRRIEFWGELGRIKDILRLKQGYTRNYSGSNHTEMLVGKNTNANSGAFLFNIPQTEFDGNVNIDSSEQNPTE